MISTFCYWTSTVYTLPLFRLVIFNTFFSFPHSYLPLIPPPPPPEGGALPELLLQCELLGRLEGSIFFLLPSDVNCSNKPLYLILQVLYFNFLFISFPLQEYNICFTTVERSLDGSVPRLPSSKRTGLLPEVSTVYCMFS